MSRLLKVNDHTETPSNLVFFDTEAVKMPDETRGDAYYLSLRLWAATRVRLENGAITRRHDEWGKDADSFWSFLDRVSDEQRTTWLFAHNLAFDATMIHFWEKLDDGYITVRPLWRQGNSNEGEKHASWRGRIVAERSPCYFFVRRGRRTYRFVDTYNYWPKGLAKIAETLGIQKRDLPKWTDPDEEWLDRCNSDVAILEHAVLSLIANWRAQDCGTFQPTAAALALNHFRHTCDVRTPDGKAIDMYCGPDPKAHELEREAYYGGRWQCFYVGELNGDFYHLDVNSLYPFVMKLHSYPRRLAGQASEVSHATLEAKAKCYDCCARVLINTRAHTFPVRVDGVQYHAYGKFFTTLCGPELLRALESDSIVRILKLQWYSRAPIFRSWVDYWYSRKLDAASDRDNRSADYEFAKLMLNSLAGKWAQHGRYWRDVPDAIPVEPWGGWPVYKGVGQPPERWRGLGKTSQRLSEDAEPAHSFPLISALIASYAREYMREIVQLCPYESVFYQACDSIICDAHAYRKLSEAFMIHPNELGLLRLIGRHKYVHIRGSNNYTLDDADCVGGLLGRMVRSGRTDGKVDVWEGMPGLLAGGPKSRVRVSQVDVTPAPPEFKGFINRWGWWEPHCLIDSEDWRGGPPKDGYRRECFSDTPAGRTLLDA